ncbi:MAG: NAD(P)/FAD-dependent oxidoreductase [Methanomassiliicoccus sp.]|nr:NAD(P)/FAD-dependent oxidoreductase [Methanomassiliicoccus sp.]
MKGGRSVLIIGAGIAGLSAGIYACKNGYDVMILEMHDKPGGMCTSWKRGDYLFDYSIHNLAGSGKDAGLRKLWEELGALDGLEVIDHEEFARVEDQDGRSFTMYSDIDRTVAELRRVSPDDADVIDSHERMARRFARLDLFGAAMGMRGMLRIMPHLRTVSWLGKETMEDKAAEFSDPFLRRAFPTLQYGFSNMPLIVHYIFQGGLDRGDLGFVRGGSLKFSRNLESRFLALGGKMRYRSRVTEVIVEGSAATGVRLADGTDLRADAVISAADGRSTIFDLLGGRFKDQLMVDYYQSGWWPKDQEMGTSVFLGVKRDLSDESHALSLLLKEPLSVDGRDIDHLDLELFDARSGLVPDGKGVIKVNLPCNYDRWKELRADGNAYLQAKKGTMETIVSTLEPRFPGLREQVEVSDMTTLVTCERYTGCFRGLQPWGSKRDQTRIARKGMSRTLPGLDNFYMAGQWAEAGIGIPTAALSARRAVRAMCKKDGIRFRG